MTDSLLDRLKELAYSGRVIGGNEAEEIGLITSVSENPLEEARALAAEIADKSPDAIRAIKMLVNDSWDDSIQNGLRREAELQMKVLKTDNQTEAVTANLENRAAEFQAATLSD